MGKRRGTVFISYAWSVSDELVDRLYGSLQDDGFDVRRDRHDLGYKGSISEFMQQIADGDCVVAIISDKYIRSPYCMRELLHIHQRNPRDHGERIFPFVLPDAHGIFDSVKRLDYVPYWTQRIKDLHEKISEVGNKISAETQRELQLMREFELYVDDMLRAIIDMNVLTPAKLESGDFQVLKEAIERRLDQLFPRVGPVDLAAEHQRRALELLDRETELRQALAKFYQLSESSTAAALLEKMRGESYAKLGAKLELLHEKLSEAAQDQLFQFLAFFLPLASSSEPTNSAFAELREASETGYPARFKLDSGVRGVSQARSPIVETGVSDHQRAIQVEADVRAILRMPRDENLEVDGELAQVIERCALLAELGEHERIEMPPVYLVYNDAEANEAWLKLVAARMKRLRFRKLSSATEEQRSEETALQRTLRVLLEKRDGKRVR